MSVELQRKLKKARQKAGESQGQFSQNLGVPVQTLQSWEANRRTPKGLALKALNEKLDAILADG